MQLIWTRPTSSPRCAIGAQIETCVTYGFAKTAISLTLKFNLPELVHARYFPSGPEIDIASLNRRRRIRHSARVDRYNPCPVASPAIDDLRTVQMG
jgi:hypothetical protein